MKVHEEDNDETDSRPSELLVGHFVLNKAPES